MLCPEYTKPFERDVKKLKRSHRDLEPLKTVKTYIKRTYAKLGVHSQQELIDLVEKG